MWQHNSAPVLQLAKASSGVGMVVAPLLAGPFIKGKIVPDNFTLYEFLNKTHSTATGDEAIDDYNQSIERRADLELPFLVGGIANLIIPISMRYKYLEEDIDCPTGGTGMSPDDRRATLHSIKEFTIKKPIVEQSALMKWTFVALIATSLSTYGAMENMHLVYSSTYYQLSAVQMSASRAADVLSVLNASLTVGKLISTFIALKVKANIMLMYHMVLLAISQAVLYFGRTSQVMVWIGNVLMGFGYSAIWPSYFQFGEDFVGLTDNIAAIFALVSAICPMITPFFFGPLVEENPDIFIIMEFDNRSLLVKVVIKSPTRLYLLPPLIDYM
ncbi:unnamed protein product [Oppiella nova]|uniref:Uncharacterized protein n=1 Tax=Oppiella nova TaxID=334625 RepID=A0A7R9MCC1_9ACAR|nr:unnamed protein product [Oppiella nova]CAG2174712.1 unnamed protein product [Oppiella nova]